MTGPVERPNPSRGPAPGPTFADWVDNLLAPRLTGQPDQVILSVYQTRFRLIVLDCVLAAVSVSAAVLFYPTALVFSGIIAANLTVRVVHVAALGRECRRRGIPRRPDPDPTEDQ